ncbi:MAG: magnesium/cobalt transporter CorA [Bacteroidetes bacterium]|jgi:magnesium transporter|nr:magnesium/cobalt transporter CorA [Bacteroidota bacterium]
MARFILPRLKSKGEPPGTLIHIGSQKMKKSIVTLFKFNTDELFTEIEITPEQLKTEMDDHRVNWINVYGLHDTKLIQTIGEIFSIDPLILEDILNTDQRPKLTEENEHPVFILKDLSYDKTEQKVSAEQVSIMLHENKVIVFHERRGELFNPVKDRINKSRGKIRTRKAAYLVYALMDTIVDNYLTIIEQLGDEVEKLGLAVLKSSDNKLAQQLFHIKTELNYLRRHIRPLRELMNQWSKTEYPHFDKSIHKFIKDLHDLVNQCFDALDSYEVLLTDYQNVLFSNQSNRTNEIMRVLTIFASIFIPLTFVAGIYGTNFSYIPEFNYKYSYFIFWGALVIIAGWMLFYFRRKKWF